MDERWERDRASAIVDIGPRMRLFADQDADERLGLAVPTWGVRRRGDVLEAELGDRLAIARAQAINERVRSARSDTPHGMWDRQARSRGHSSAKRATTGKWSDSRDPAVGSTATHSIARKRGE